MKKLVMIDGNSIMNRAFYGIMNSKMLVTTDGIYTNAIYGFLTILLKLLNDEKPDYLCVAFDLKAPTFRHKKYEQYKATRKGMPEELRMQMPFMKEVLNAMNIKIFEEEGFEADDVIGSIAKIAEKKGIDVLILTGDRDYLQLASRKTTIKIPTTKMGATEYNDYTPKKIKEKFGITPEQFKDIKGLMGDTSDNIPGVPGVGEKTAFSLIGKYKSLENIYAKLDENEELDGIKGKLKEKLIENKELAFLSKDLGTICLDVPLKFEMKDISFKDYNNDALYNLFVKLQFRKFIEQLGLKQQENVNDESYKYVFEKFDVKPIQKLEINSEFSYYYGNGLAVFANGTAYYSSKPSMEELKRVFESDALKIGYNEKNDYLKLRKLGVKPKNMMFDLAIASYLLNPSKESYKLDDIIMEELGVVVENNDENVQISFDSFEKETDYEDIETKYAKYIFDCKVKLENDLKGKEQIKLFNEIEMPLVKVLAEMEYTGVLVDRKILEEYSKSLREKVNSLLEKIYELAGEEFNVNSTKQLGVLLFEKLQLPVIRKTKTGYSTDVDVLDKLKGEHPIIEKILEYRTISKLKATYVDGMLPLINEETHRIHAKFNQTVAATGRISCTEPNLQNIPIRTEFGKQLRKIFIAKENYIFLDADYSQIELRVLAHMSGDENMIRGFNADSDIHAITASQVFDVPLEEVTKQMRTEAKAVNFGIVYGISDFGLAENIGISRKKAKEYIEKYFEKYPKIKEYMDSTVVSCRQKGYVETLWGRRRYVPEIKSSNYNVRQFGERVAMNAPIQGTAADIIKIAMINIQKKLEENNLNSKLILQVHDELVIEADVNELEQVKEILVTCMENVVKLKVPLKVEAQEGKDWFDAH